MEKGPANSMPKESALDDARLEHIAGQIESLLRIWRNEASERKRAKRLLELANNDMIKHLRKMPAEPAHHSRAKPKYTAGIVSLALKQLSYLYDEEPARRMQGGDAEQEWAREKLWSWEMGLSNTMAHADSMARLHDVCLVWSRYVAHPDAPYLARVVAEGRELPEGASEEDDGVEGVVITRDRFAVLCNPVDNRKAEAVLVHLATVQKTVGALAVPSRDVFAYWDRDVWACVEVSLLGGQFDVVDAEEHGYGCIPLDVVRNVEGGTSFYPEYGSWGGRDLEGNVKAVNDLLTEYGWTAKLQRGQPWATGKLESNNLAPDAVIVVEPGSTFGIASNGANLSGIRDAVLTLLDILAKTLGLPSRTFKLEASQGTSGIAIALDRAELADDRKSREKLARYWERKIHRTAAKVYNAHRGTSWSGRVVTSFKPFIVPLTPEQQLARLGFELEHALVGREDALRELRPELSDEQIAERLAKRDEEDAARATEGIEAA